MDLEQPIGRGLRHKVLFPVGEAHGQLPGRQVRFLESQINQLALDFFGDAVPGPIRGRTAVLEGFGAAAPTQGPIPTSVAFMSAQASGDSRRSAKWETRRQAIIDTSAHLFARQGYHATGIMELCVANDLGKGALYHYIGSKEELLAAIHDRVMDEVLLGADRVAAAGGRPSEQLAMFGD